MKADVRDYVVEKVKEMMDSFSCCGEAKAAGQSWLNAVGTDKEAEETKKLITYQEDALEARLDGLKGFQKGFAMKPENAYIAGTAEGKGFEIVKENEGNQLAVHGEEIKAAGGKYCDCPACAAVAAILEKKEEMV